MLTIIATVAYLVAVAFASNKTDFFEKSQDNPWIALPVTLLGLLLVSFDRKLATDSRILFGLAALTCGAGDYVINHGHFTFGAALFAVGHIFYIVSNIDLVRKWWTPLVVGSYTAAVVVNFVSFHDKVFDTPTQVSVLVTYSFILMTAFTMAGSIWFHQKESKLKLPSKSRFIGYILLIVSDSVLLLTRDSVAIPHAHQIIFVTYYSAQLLIFLGNYHSDAHISHKKTS